MHKMQANMPAQGLVLSAQNMSEIFKLLDKDGSGLLTGAEIDEMFMRICGMQVNVAGKQSYYDLRSFHRLVEQLNRTYREFHVVRNLIDYLTKSNAGAGTTSEGDPFCLANCKKLIGVLDKDGSGQLEIMEMYEMFQGMGLGIDQLNKASREFGGRIKDENDMQRLLKELDQANPGIAIDDKVIHYIGASAGGTAPPPSHASHATHASSLATGPTSGTKKALLVGINYFGGRCPLSGCINDVRNQMDTLCNHFGFHRENCDLLTDDQDPSRHPTRQNIMAGLENLISGAKSGDFLFFHYSGHGTQVPDTTGDEPDGMDEAICPCDHERFQGASGFITDDEFKEKFFDRVPDACHCVCIFDCCHSGSMSDLYCIRGGVQNDEVPRFLAPNPELQAMIAQQFDQMLKTGKNQKPTAQKMQWHEHAGKNIVTFSGCQDNQTSADVHVDGQAQGAFTWGFLKAVRECNYRCTYDQLHNATKRNIAMKGYRQVPSLASTNESNLGQAFMS